jgi:hypothetical protein
MWGLSFRHHRAHAGPGVEARDARAACAHPLGQRALRVELELELSAEVLAHELGVLAHVGRHHLADLAALEQHAQAEAVDAGVVGGDREVPGARVADGGDQELGDAAQAEASGGDQHAVE